MSEAALNPEPAADATPPAEEQPSLNQEDLDLVQGLADQSASPEEIWDDLDRQESEGGAPEAFAHEDDFEEAGDPPASSDPGSEEPEPETPDGSPSGSSDASTPDDIWAGATPEQVAAFKAAQEESTRLQQQVRSEKGRQSALQARLREFRDSNRFEKTPEPGTAPRSGDSSEAPRIAGSEAWKKFREDYPEVANAIEPSLNDLEAQNGQLRRELDSLGDERRERAASEQQVLLEEVHPDWQQVTSNGRLMAAWLADEPRHVQEAFERNREGIVDAREAIDVVGRFKAYIDANKAPDPNPKPSEPPANARRDGNRSPSRRQMQLESSVSNPSTGHAPRTGVQEEGDPEAIWKQIDREEARRARAG